jgi:hypothetical protein
VIRYFSIGSYVVITHLVFLTYAHGQDRYHWKQIDEREGIAVYSREIDNSSLLGFRGITTVDHPPGKVVSVLKDASRRREWMPGFLESKIIHRFSDSGHIEYDRMDAP